MTDTYIPYGRQVISDADIAAVADVLRSDFLTQGPAIPAFEAAFATRVGASQAVAVCNATAALHIACLALGVGPGDVVWTSPNSFVASANCAIYCGADVDFVDVQPDTYNMDMNQLAERLRQAELAGKLPKVVIPVHFAGQPCDMSALDALRQQYGFRVIEDASHAVGATYKNSSIGDCTFSDIAVFSFHPVKIITTGEGGMALTQDLELAGRMRLLRSHGITRDADSMVSPPDGPWYYQQVELGFNYRITDLQAALGTSQLAMIDRWLDRRHEIARRYDTAFDGENLTTPVQSSGVRSALHLYPIQVENRDVAFASLRAAGIGVNVHYIPIHTQPFYRARGFAPGMFPESEAYYARAMSLPMFASLTNEQQDRVCEEVLKAIR